MVRGTDARVSRGPSLSGSTSRPQGPRFLPRFHDLLLQGRQIRPPPVFITTVLSAHVVSVAAFVLPWWTEATWPQPEIFTVWRFTAKVC